MSGIREPLVRRRIRGQIRRDRSNPTKPNRSLKIGPISEKHVTRLWSRIEKRGADECWPWTGAVSVFGHGRFRVGKRLYLPHRLIFSLECEAIQDVPEYHGTVVMHTCDNPACCNPQHLRTGKQHHNVRDMADKGRGANRYRSPLPHIRAGAV